MKIKITPEMHDYAEKESARRNNHIRHHFEVPHLTARERDKIGFLGEFACCEFFGIDWKLNIRENYIDIDDCDVIIKNKKIDVKTETVPLPHAEKIINGKISDDEIYGRRLININQYNLLKKYDITVFGFFIRDNLEYWYPIGFIESDEIIRKYPPTDRRPDGGKYPYPGSPVPTSILKPLRDLQ